MRSWLLFSFVTLKQFLKIHLFGVDLGVDESKNLRRSLSSRSFDISKNLTSLRLGINIDFFFHPSFFSLILE